ncbi:MAG: hypothetical protein V3V22_06390, partial [Methylococcales bacterium]
MKSNDKLEHLPADCPVNYKLTDVEHVESYYASFVNDKSEYIAFKEFSYLGGYKLVSLIRNDNSYILSVSLPTIPNGTIHKEIDLRSGRIIFEKIKNIQSLDAFDGEESFHPTCIIVGIKISNMTSVSSLYNKLIVIPEHSNNSQNSGVRSYSLLLSLVNTQLPDYA